MSNWVQQQPQGGLMGNIPGIFYFLAARGTEKHAAPGAALYYMMDAIQLYCKNNFGLNL